MNEYLDKSGLQTLVEKLTDKYDTRYASPVAFASAALPASESVVSVSKAVLL